MSKELECRGPLLFFIDKAFLYKVLGCLRKAIWDFRNFMPLQLLNQLIKVLDSVPWVLSRCQLDQCAAKGPDVTSAPDRLEGNDLRGHPEDTSLEVVENGAGLLVVALLKTARVTEVCQFYLTAICKNVCSLQVTMNDRQFMVVQVVESF